MAAKRKTAKKTVARPKDLKPRKGVAKAVKGGRPGLPPGIFGFKDDLRS